MTKFHINAEGNPGSCTATVYGCRFGSAETHFSSEADARAAYERRMCAAFALDKLSTKTVKEPGEAMYEEVSDEKGLKLGTVTYREGVYLASTHDGRRPVSHGQFDNREEALAVLLANRGKLQAQGTASA